MARSALFAAGAFVILLLALRGSSAENARDALRGLGGNHQAPGFLHAYGVEKPPLHDQRFRRSLYPKDKPFFQWWYFCAKDLENDRYYTFTYAYSFCAHNKTNEGFYMGISYVDAASGTHWQRVDKFPLASVQQSGDMDVSLADASGLSNQHFSLRAIDDNNFRIQGRLASKSPSIWRSFGGHSSSPIEDAEWDLALERVYGWYGEGQFEIPDRMYGVIQWNPYAHNTLGKGTVDFGALKSTFTPSPQFRVYGDMNWGDQFPSAPAGSTDRAYSWGWYNVALPDPKGDTAKDLSIVAGTGLTRAAFPFYSMLGQFADIHIPGAQPVSVTEVGFWEKTKEAENIVASSDGEFKSFEVTRGNWTTIEDDLGTAVVPLEQTVHIVTKLYDLTMHFESEPEQGYVFSDFEALGVRVNVRMVERSTGNEVFNEWVKNGGLEFGCRNCQQS